VRNHLLADGVPSKLRYRKIDALQETEEEKDGCRVNQRFCGRTISFLHGFVEYLFPYDSLKLAARLCSRWPLL
jgi:hypothetical protein